jgi:hypothetical protein
VEIDIQERTFFIGKLGLLNKIDLLECLVTLIQQPMLEHQRGIIQEYAAKGVLKTPDEPREPNENRSFPTLRYPETPLESTSKRMEEQSCPSPVLRSEKRSSSFDNLDDDTLDDSSVELLMDMKRKKSKKDTKKDKLKSISSYMNLLK